MTPDQAKIKISNNKNQIIQLLTDLVIRPRTLALDWSKITKQSPSLRVGYPGQHLASLITGVEGERTGARGNDLADGSEVKSCSRIDQVGLCRDCKAPVAQSEAECSSCSSKNILRKDDSKWLFSIKSATELQQLISLPRVVLILADHPDFLKGDFEAIRFTTFEIWPSSPRGSRFREAMEDYFQNDYLVKLTAGRGTNPKNFWPLRYLFYMCNPIRTFECVVTSISSQPVVDIRHYIEPGDDRSGLESEVMPASLLKSQEYRQLISGVPRDILSKYLQPRFKKATTLDLLANFKIRKAVLTGVSEELRNYLNLRVPKLSASTSKSYKRRGII